MSLQARPEIRRFPLFALLAWSMAAGAVIDAHHRLRAHRPAGLRPAPAYWAGVLYLALLASVLTFSLYYPVVRKIGPAKAAYSSVHRADHRDGLFDLARRLSLDAADGRRRVARARRHGRAR